MRDAPPRRQQPRPAKTPAVKLVVCHHQLTDYQAGEVCPECQRGKLRKYEPATLLRISGQTPFVPTQHVMERLRCNACGAYFTAPLPEEITQDGEPGQKYGFSTCTLMALGKYFAANANYFYIDDTSQKILNATPVLKPKRRDDRGGR